RRLHNERRRTAAFMPNLGSSANFGSIEVSRAPETTDTELTPLTCSSLRSEPIDLESRARCARSRSSRLAASRYVLQHITGVRSCLCTRSPSAVSGQCQRCQRPSLRSGPVLFEVARARRSLLLLCHPEIPRRTQIGG